MITKYLCLFYWNCKKCQKVYQIQTISDVLKFQNKGLEIKLTVPECVIYTISYKKKLNKILYVQFSKLTHEFAFIHSVL